MSANTENTSATAPDPEDAAPLWRSRTWTALNSTAPVLTTGQPDQA